MTTTKKLILILACTGCGPASYYTVDLGTLSSATPVVCTVELDSGACIGIDPDASPAPTIDLARWNRAMEEALAYWDASDVQPTNLKIGITYHYVTIQHRDGTVTEHNGSFGWLDDAPTMWLQVPFSGGCPEWELPHEVGHYLLGDGAHVDPRWKGVHGVIGDLPGCQTR